MGRRCVVAKCNNTTAHGVTLHTIPSDKSIARKWYNFVNITRKWDHSLESAIESKSQICSDHFTLDCYSSSQLMQRRMGYNPMMTKKGKIRASPIIDFSCKAQKGYAALRSPTSSTGNSSQELSSPIQVVPGHDADVCDKTTPSDNTSREVPIPKEPTVISNKDSQTFSILRNSLSREVTILDTDFCQKSHSCETGDQVVTYCDNSESTNKPSLGVNTLSVEVPSNDISENLNGRSPKIENSVHDNPACKSNVQTIDIDSVARDNSYKKYECELINTNLNSSKPGTREEPSGSAGANANVGFNESVAPPPLSIQCSQDIARDENCIQENSNITEKEIVETHKAIDQHQNIRNDKELPDPQIDNGTDIGPNSTNVNIARVTNKANDHHQNICNDNAKELIDLHIDNQTDNGPNCTNRNIALDTKEKQDLTLKVIKSEVYTPTAHSSKDISNFKAPRSVSKNHIKPEYKPLANRTSTYNPVPHRIYPSAMPRMKVKFKLKIENLQRPNFGDLDPDLMALFEAPVLFQTMQLLLHVSNLIMKRVCKIEPFKNGDKFKLQLDEYLKTQAANRKKRRVWRTPDGTIFNTKEEYAEWQWTEATKRNERRMAHQVKSGEANRAKRPPPKKIDISMLTDDQKQKLIERQKIIQQKRWSYFVQREKMLLKAANYIVTGLRKTFVNTERVARALRTLNDIQVTGYMLKSNYHVVEAVYKVSLYEKSRFLKTEALNLYNKWQSLFMIPEQFDFIDYLKIKYGEIEEDMELYNKNKPAESSGEEASGEDSETGSDESDETESSSQTAETPIEQINVHMPRGMKFYKSPPRPIYKPPKVQPTKIIPIRRKIVKESESEMSTDSESSDESSYNSDGSAFRCTVKSPAPVVQRPSRNAKAAAATKMKEIRGILSKPLVVSDSDDEMDDIRSFRRAKKVDENDTSLSVDDAADNASSQKVTPAETTKNVAPKTEPESPKPNQNISAPQSEVVGSPDVKEIQIQNMNFKSKIPENRPSEEINGKSYSTKPNDNNQSTAVEKLKNPSSSTIGHPKTNSKQNLAALINNMKVLKDKLIEAKTNEVNLDKKENDVLILKIARQIVEIKKKLVALKEKKVKEMRDKEHMHHEKHNVHPKQIKPEKVDNVISEGGETSMSEPQKAEPFKEETLKESNETADDAHPPLRATQSCSVVKSSYNKDQQSPCTIESSADLSNLKHHNIVKETLVEIEEEDIPHKTIAASPALSGERRRCKSQDTADTINIISSSCGQQSQHVCHQTLVTSPVTTKRADRQRSRENANETKVENDSQGKEQICENVPTGKCERRGRRRVRYTPDETSTINDTQNQKDKRETIASSPGASQRWRGRPRKKLSNNMKDITIKNEVDESSYQVLLSPPTDGSQKKRVPRGMGRPRKTAREISADLEISVEDQITNTEKPDIKIEISSPVRRSSLRRTRSCKSANSTIDDNETLSQASKHEICLTEGAQSLPLDQQSRNCEGLQSSRNTETNTIAKSIKSPKAVTSKSNADKTSDTHDTITNSPYTSNDRKRLKSLSPTARRSSRTSTVINTKCAGNIVTPTKLKLANEHEENFPNPNEIVAEQNYIVQSSQETKNESPGHGVNIETNNIEKLIKLPKPVARNTDISNADKTSDTHEHITNSPYTSYDRKRLKLISPKARRSSRTSTVINTKCAGNIVTPTKLKLANEYEVNIPNPNEVVAEQTSTVQSLQEAVHESPGHRSDAASRKQRASTPISSSPRIKTESLDQCNELEMKPMEVTKSNRKGKRNRTLTQPKKQKIPMNESILVKAEPTDTTPDIANRPRRTRRSNVQNVTITVGVDSNSSSGQHIGDMETTSRNHRQPIGEIILISPERKRARLNITSPKATGSANHDDLMRNSIKSPVVKNHRNTSLLPTPDISLDTSRRKSRIRSSSNVVVKSENIDVSELSPALSTLNNTRRAARGRKISQQNQKESPASNMNSVLVSHKSTASSYLGTVASPTLSGKTVSGQILNPVSDEKNVGMKIESPALSAKSINSSINSAFSASSVGSKIASRAASSMSNYVFNGNGADIKIEGHTSSTRSCTRRRSNQVPETDGPASSLRNRDRNINSPEFSVLSPTDKINTPVLDASLRKRGRNIASPASNVVSATKKNDVPGSCSRRNTGKSLSSPPVQRKDKKSVHKLTGPVETTSPKNRPLHCPVSVENVIENLEDPLGSIKSRLTSPKYAVEKLTLSRSKTKQFCSPASSTQSTNLQLSSPASTVYSAEFGSRGKRTPSNADTLASSIDSVIISESGTKSKDKCKRKRRTPVIEHICTNLTSPAGNLRSKDKISSPQCFSKEIKQEIIDDMSESKEKTPKFTPEN